MSEESQIPDEYFDLVTNNLLVHEMPAEKVRDLAKEAYRILRPDGVSCPLDSYTGDQPRNNRLQTRLNIHNEV